VLVGQVWYFWEEYSDNFFLSWYLLPSGGGGVDDSWHDGIRDLVFVVSVSVGRGLGRTCGVTICFDSEEG